MDNLEQLNAGVLIPTVEIEKALAKAAIPGFYGDVTIEIRIKPEAVENVALTISRTATLKAAAPEQRPAAGKSEAARDVMVHQAVLKLKEKLQLRCGLVEIKANFADGKLLDLKLTDAL